MGVAVGSDGTIFLANGGNGLRAYTYDGSSLTGVGHIGNIWDSNDVTVSPDGTVFLADGHNGLRTFSYNGGSFTQITSIAHGGPAASIGVTMGSDGSIFLANEGDGLRAYSFNGSSLTNTAQIRNGGTAWNVVTGPDGTVFLANWEDGLRAYQHTGNSFMNTAHVGHNSPSADIAVAADGTVFLVNDSDGLFAYSYDALTAIDDAISAVPEAFTLEQNYPNPFNPSTTITFSLPKSEFVTLVIYNMRGQMIKTLINSNLINGQHSVSWDGTNQAGEHVVSGTYIYSIKAGSQTASRKMLLLQ